MEALVADVPREVELVVVLFCLHVSDRDTNSFALRHPENVWFVEFNTKRVREPFKKVWNSPHFFFTGSLYGRQLT